MSKNAKLSTCTSAACSAAMFVTHSMECWRWHSLYLSPSYCMPCNKTSLLALRTSTCGCHVQLQYSANCRPVSDSQAWLQGQVALGPLSVCLLIGIMVQSSHKAVMYLPRDKSSMSDITQFAVGACKAACCDSSSVLAASLLQHPAW